MSNSTTYTETVLPELAYLVTACSGDSAILNAPAGFASYFERGEVVECGREIHQARLRAVTDADDRQTVSSYFEAAGAVIAATAASFAATSTTAAGVSMMYFSAHPHTVEIVIAEGRTIFALHAEAPTLNDLLQRHFDDDPEVAMIGRFDTGGDGRYLAIARGDAAYSDDGQQWRADDSGDQRDPREIVRAFAAVGNPAD